MPQVQTHTHTGTHSVCINWTKQNKANNSIGCHKLPPQPPSPSPSPPAGGYSIDIYLFQLHFLCLTPLPPTPKHKFNLQNVLRSFASPTPTLDSSAGATLNPTAASAVYQSSGQHTERQTKSIASQQRNPVIPLLPCPGTSPPAAWSMRLALVAVVCWQINEEICKLSKLNAL